MKNKMEKINTFYENLSCYLYQHQILFLIDGIPTAPLAPPIKVWGGCNLTHICH